MNSIGRRDFLKMGTAGVAGWTLRPWLHIDADDFPDGERLGRVCVGKVELKATPDADGATVGALYEDAVVVWLRERVGRYPYRINQTWVETPDGYLYAPQVQPVANRPNDPVQELKETSLGLGMWVEVTVPWVRVILDNPPARSPWLKNTDQPRLYYSQILWVDAIREDESGTHWYRINERFGFGDIFWAPAAAFRPLDADEIAPIRPEVEAKEVVVDVNHQTMACYEDGREVYFCQVATGAKFNAEGESVDKWSTPVGPHPIWRKVISLHMVGGTTGGGYDLPGIGWTTLFSGDGVAVHSTFWHNDFGVPRSHGCVNAKPEDAKWVFRWVTPAVSYDPGDVTVGMPGGTRVRVVEG
ncbi:MAG: L,D-transpeptidase [Anaerolineales bacterium]